MSESNPLTMAIDPDSASLERSLLQVLLSDPANPLKLEEQDDNMDVMTTPSAFPPRPFYASPPGDATSGILPPPLAPVTGPLWATSPHLQSPGQGGTGGYVSPESSPTANDNDVGYNGNGLKQGAGPAAHDRPPNNPVFYPSLPPINTTFGPAIKGFSSSSDRQPQPRFNGSNGNQPGDSGGRRDSGGSGKGGKGKKADGKQPTFLTKLYQILRTPEYHHIIRWDEAGDTIIVEQPEELASKILPLVYRQSRFASFSRQLNIYGFMRKVSLRNLDADICDPDASTWSHTYLNRDSTAADIQRFKRRVPPRPSQASKHRITSAPLPAHIPLQQFQQGSSPTLDSPTSSEQGVTASGLGLLYQSPPEIYQPRHLSSLSEDDPSPATFPANPSLISNFSIEQTANHGPTHRPAIYLSSSSSGGSLDHGHSYGSLPGGGVPVNHYGTFSIPRYPPGLTDGQISPPMIRHYSHDGIPETSPTQGHSPHSPQYPPQGQSYSLFGSGFHSSELPQGYTPQTAPPHASYPGFISSLQVTQGHLRTRSVQGEPPSATLLSPSSPTFPMPIQMQRSITFGGIGTQPMGRQGADVDMAMDGMDRAGDRIPTYDPNDASTWVRRGYNDIHTGQPVPSPPSPFKVGVHPVNQSQSFPQPYAPALLSPDTPTKPSTASTTQNPSPTQRLSMTLPGNPHSNEDRTYAHTRYVHDQGMDDGIPTYKLYSPTGAARTTMPIRSERTHSHSTIGNPYHHHHHHGHPHVHSHSLSPGSRKSPTNSGGLSEVLSFGRTSQGRRSTSGMSIDMETGHSQHEGKKMQMHQVGDRLTYGQDDGEVHHHQERDGVQAIQVETDVEAGAEELPSANVRFRHSGPFEAVLSRGDALGRE